VAAGHGICLAANTNKDWSFSMSLMRQIGLLLATVLLLSLAGAVGINLASTRDALQTQLRMKNSDNAQNIALALSQQHGDIELMSLLLASQADTGFYRRVRLVKADGQAAFERESQAQAQQAPEWFARLWPIESAPGVAQVSDGWRALGRVEVISHVAYAHDELWRGGSRALLLLAALGVAALAFAAAGVRRIRRPLDDTVAQANALVDGRYLLVDEPDVPELQRVARAMNGMVERVRRLFEAQAAQVEQLRREAHEDRLTGLPHRGHFMQRFSAMLGDDACAEAGSLLLVRVAELAEVNRELGRELTDRALRTLADTLRAWPHDGALAGRLNGADFALALPGHALPLPEAASTLAGALREAMAGISQRLVLHIGAAPWRNSTATGAGALLARADLALARAEGMGPFAAEIDVDAGVTLATGEQGWHRDLQDALTQRRARLAEYVVLDHGGALLHLECPLRVQLGKDGAYQTAARWLPLASRSRLLPALDLLAVRLALTAIAADGRPRAINLALASLSDGAFTTQLRQLLVDSPRGARGLWLEIGEGAALGHFELVRAFAALVRPLGVRFGLEHAGHQLYRAPRLYELGIDYVKLDVALVRGAAQDDAVRRFVAGSVALLRALPVAVCAEGVDDAGDAAALWECGVEAITGPWASARQPKA
jgi:EAL domain-containing protein (putative c-di-GMP-specific phosphodiesterase class I)/GGDEF domain-containing protein